MSQTQRDATSAWLWLVGKGGIEPNGRDEQLVSMLKDRLDTEAPDLEHALANATLTGFLNAFFGVAVPFVEMMKDLFAYFESAGATEGPANWVLVLNTDDEPLEVDLSAFKQWLEAPQRKRSASRTVPILKTAQLWELRKHFYPAREKDPDIRPESDVRQPEPRTKDADLIKWLEAYGKGNFEDLPSVVSRSLADPGGVGDVAALVMDIYSAIRGIARNRAELKRKGSRSAGEVDFWSAAGLAGFETDGWLPARVLDLATYEQATPEQQTLVEQGLATEFRNAPRRLVRFDIDISDLEEILSLPAWERRYELYSAWILTAILRALQGHLIQLHHEHGRIRFAFRETLMASIPSAAPPLEIYSERRVRAVNPVGHGRIEGAQPDYSLWNPFTGTCKLAIECKQYARSSTQNFSAALTDYARALSEAKVILANYGPVGENVLNAVPNDVRDRCEAIANVRPDSAEPLERFHKVVKQIIGKPNPNLKTDEDLHREVLNAELLVIDISGSMSTSIDSPSGLESITDLIRRVGAKRLATVDDHLVAEGPAGGAGVIEILSKRGTGGTDLGPAVTRLKEAGRSILVLTDDDGVKTLTGLRFRQLGSLTIGNTSAHLLLVT